MPSEWGRTFRAQRSRRKKNPYLFPLQSIHCRGSLERMEFLGCRPGRGGYGSPPARMLSSSFVNFIQSFTKMTRWGVLSLKKNLERNIRKITGEIGKLFSSMITAVWLASGAKISRTQPDM